MEIPLKYSVFHRSVPLKSRHVTPIMDSFDSSCSSQDGRCATLGEWKKRVDVGSEIERQNGDEEIEEINYENETKICIQK